MVQKAKKQKTAADKIRELNAHKSTIYGINRQKQSPVTSGSTTLGNFGGSAGGSTSAAGNYVKRTGDRMSGPLAFHPKTAIIDNGQINISESSGSFSSNVIVASESGLTDILLTITGAAFAGQLLVVQGVQTATITLKDSLSSGTAWVTSTSYSLGDIVANGGTLYSCKNAHLSGASTEPGVGADWTDEWYQANIETIDGTDFDIEDDDNIIFKFDSTDNKWQQVTIGKQAGTGGGGGVTFPIEPTVTDNGAGWTGTQTLNLNTGDGHIYKWTVDQDLTFASAVSNIPSSGTQRTFELEFDHDEVGDTFTVTLPSNFVDQNGNVFTSFTITTGKALLSVRVNNGTDFLVFKKNVTGTSFTGATTQLDNLSLPVLNTSINFNSNAPTNFNGYTSQIIGNTLVNDATGSTWTLPLGDIYDWKINGVSAFTVAAAAIGMGAPLGMNTNKITNLGAPTVDTDAATKKYVDDNAGATTFEDSTFDIHDNITPAKILTFSVGNFNSATSLIASVALTAARTWTLPDISGTFLMTTGTQTISAIKTFNANIDFGGNGTIDIGTTTTHANNIFTENLTFRGSGDAIISTRSMIAADAGSLIFHAPSADDFLYQVAAATKMQFNATGGSDDIRIRAGASRVLGFITDSSATTLGTSGTIKGPVDTGSVGNAAAADTDFGDDVGCQGLYLNTIGSGNPTFCIKIDDGSGTDNRWAAITINRTTGALTGGVLT